MRGRMLWFNGEKDLGLIEAEDGSRLSVEGDAFAPGARPTGGRCGGTIVAFSVVDGDEPRAADVTLVPRTSRAVRAAATAARSSYVQFLRRRDPCYLPSRIASESGLREAPSLRVHEQ